jgi:hypothetical protein
MRQSTTYMYLWKSEHTCIARLLLLTQPGDCSLVEWLSNPNESHRRCASTINALLERLKRTRGWVDPNRAYALSTHVVLRHGSAEEHTSLTPTISRRNYPHFDKMLPTNFCPSENNAKLPRSSTTSGLGSDSVISYRVIASCISPTFDSRDKSNNERMERRGEESKNPLSSTSNPSPPLSSPPSRQQ